MNFDTLVEEWFAQHFHGLGPLIDVTTYNRCYAAKEDLKAKLNATKDVTHD